MRFVPTPLEGAFVIELDKRKDDRGFFARVFCEREFGAAGLDMRFVQINNSLSKDKGTLRGMHYQLGEAAEVKVVRCVRGALWDAILDLRPGSEFRAELRRRAQRRKPAHDVCAARLCARLSDARRGYRGILPGLDLLRPGPRARRALERPAFCDQLAGAAAGDLGQGRATARFRPGLAFGGLSGRGPWLISLSLTAGKKPASAPEEPPLNVENMLPISNLETIWPSPPAAEFRAAKRGRQRNGRGIRHTASRRAPSPLSVASCL